MAASYPPPVDQLLTHGETKANEWPNYLELGLGPEHVPDLIRMALDTELYWGPAESPEVSAPIHASRALGQLRAEEAIEPLVEIFDEEEQRDWLFEELPTVFGMIGRAAIPTLTRFLADRSRDVYGRATAANGLVEIAQHDPEAREEIVAAIVRQLDELLEIPQEEYQDDDYTLAGFLVGDLLDLNAVEAAPVMERAFAEKRVDEAFAGDWEDVQVRLGLLEERLTPKPRHTPFGGMASVERPGDPFAGEPPPQQRTHREAKAKAKTKAKKKMARQSRKQQRRRKKK